MHWQKQYLSLFINKIGPLSSQKARKWWSDLYHAKVMTNEEAKKLITIQEDVPFQRIEKVVPYPTARDIVLSSPAKLTVYECGCRLARKEHCEPTQVCLWIGEPFADFMREHHPLEGRKITQQEALEILSAEHTRGHGHTAWFKDAMLDRFYVICNCCPCCCGGIEVMVKYDIPMLASSGYVAQVNDELCQVCGSCVDICPFKALSLEAVAVLDWEKCMGYSVCIDQWPEEAIALILDDQKGTPLNVHRLIQPVEIT